MNLHHVAYLILTLALGWLGGNKLADWLFKGRRRRDLILTLILIGLAYLVIQLA